MHIILLLMSGPTNTASSNVTCAFSSDCMQLPLELYTTLFARVLKAPGTCEQTFKYKIGAAAL